MDKRVANIKNAHDKNIKKATNSFVHKLRRLEKSEKYAVSVCTQTAEAATRQAAEHTATLLDINDILRGN